MKLGGCGALTLLGCSIFAQNPVWTSQYDLQRTGSNIYETVLTPSNVNPQTFGRLGAMPVSGCVVAQPLYAQNTVYVATTSNWLYAFDAVTLAPLFSRNFGIPVPSYDIDVVIGYYDFPDCDGVDQPGPIGIVGTPVIDIIEGALYLVSASKDDDARHHHTLYKVDLKTGADLTPGVAIETDGFDSRYQLQRAALLLVNSRVHVAFSSHDDERPYKGWLFAYDTGLNQIAAVNYSPGRSGAGIWQSGAGPAVGGQHIYLTTGNNAEGIATDADASDSVLQLDPDTLEIVAKVSFPNEANNWDYSNDIDLGSSRVIPLPGRAYAVAGSKYGDIFVIDRKDMHLVNRFQASARHSSGFDWTGIYNGLAVWGDFVFVWCSGGGQTHDDVTNFPTDVLKSFRIAGDGSVKGVALGQTDGVGVGYQGAGLTISSNGADPTTAIVWALTPDGNTNWLRSGHLRAYAAASTGVFQQLWSDPDNSNAWAKFSQPLVANGRVYVPTFSGSVLVFGLLGQ